MLWYTLGGKKQSKKDEEGVHEKSDLLAARFFYLLIFLALNSELMRRQKDPLKSDEKLFIPQRKMQPSCGHYNNL